MILDTVGMFDAAAALPEQLTVAADAAGAALAASTPWTAARPSSVVVLGAGVAAQAAHLVQAVVAPTCPVPVLVEAGRALPAHVGPGALVVATSFDGDTPETVAAAEQVAATGASLVCLSRGGALAELADATGRPRLAVAPDAPTGRAALGALTVGLLLGFEHAGLHDGARGSIAAAAVHLARRRDELITEDNPARRLARRLGRAFPIVYGGEPLGAVAAQRWKARFNQDAKVAAFAGSLPELAHDEICGWGQDGDVTRQVFQLFLLRHGHEHPATAAGMDALVDMLDEVVGAVHVVVAQGGDALAQSLDLVLTGDFTALHAAAEQGVDPGPVPALADLRARAGTA